MAATSDATKFSPSPIPTTRGDPFRAPTILPGSREERTARPYAPVTSRRAFCTASSSEPLYARAMRWAKTSVSVSVWKMAPSFTSRFFSV
jgi:hypothetical protein